MAQDLVHLYRNVRHVLSNGLDPLHEPSPRGQPGRQEAEGDPGAGVSPEPQQGTIPRWRWLLLQEPKHTLPLWYGPSGREGGRRWAGGLGPAPHPTHWPLTQVRPCLPGRSAYMITPAPEPSPHGYSLLHVQAAHILPVCGRQVLGLKQTGKLECKPGQNVSRPCWETVGSPSPTQAQLVRCSDTKTNSAIPH